VPVKDTAPGDLNRCSERSRACVTTSWDDGQVLRTRSPNASRGSSNRYRIGRQFEQFLSHILHSLHRIRLFSGATRFKASRTQSSSLELRQFGYLAMQRGISDRWGRSTR
jgi:hypothetical protein